MTNAKHTPGPWHVGLRQAEQIVYNAAGWAVANATVYHGESDVGETKANARLIAAAPDLLAACHAALDNLAPAYASDHVVIVSLRAAIAKAEGR